VARMAVMTTLAVSSELLPLLQFLTRSVSSWT
jgi:hypothetical protein